MGTLDTGSALPASDPDNGDVAKLNSTHAESTAAQPAAGEIGNDVPHNEDKEADADGDKKPDDDGDQDDDSESETSSTRKEKEVEKEERTARKRLIKLYEALSNVRSGDDKMAELMDEAQYQIKKLKAATAKAEKAERTRQKKEGVTPVEAGSSNMPAPDTAKSESKSPAPVTTLPPPPGPVPQAPPLTSAGLVYVPPPPPPLSSSYSSSSSVLTDTESTYSSSSSYSRRRRRRRRQGRKSGRRRRIRPPPPLQPQFPAIASYSIPAVRIADWQAVVSHPLEARHAAIEIPLNEPTAEDHRRLLRAARPPFPRAVNRDGDPVNTLAALEAEAATALAAVDGQEKQLPERIRINSGKIKAVLDFDNGIVPSFGPFAGPIPNPWTQSFTLIRPFKRLVYMEKEVRNRLVEFETLRRDYDYTKHPSPPGDLAMNAARERNPKTEEEYDKLYEEFEPRDLLNSVWPIQGINYLSIIALTGIIKDVRLLVKFLDDYVNPMQQKAVSGKDEMVRFCDLWYYFQPGTMVYVNDKKIPQKIWKVGGTTGGRRRLCRDPSEPPGTTRDFLEIVNDFKMDNFHFDWNGTRYFMVLKWFFIKRFDGAVPLSSLPVVPLAVAESLGLVNRPGLVKRGKRFRECTTVSHQYYDGRSLDRSPRGDRLRGLLEDSAGVNHYRVSTNSERISSEVVVDFERALDEINEWKEEERQNFDVLPDRTERGNSLAIDYDEAWDAQLMEKVWRAENEKIRAWETKPAGPETDEDLLLLPERVFAFVLRDRKWACISIADAPDGTPTLKPIVPKQEPWNNLELPEGHKDIVKSLIESHFSKEGAFSTHFDLVKDKGKGLIILLHGVPGVGKTSTAECTAESYNRPLLPITCGDLGLLPSEVEKNLQSAFELAQAWDCIMLLDEADVFLTARETEDVQRNALVSVFLRVLEYYEGILFLTTNRVGTFDDAFKSRIHVSLYYPPLNIQQTRKIWESHIRRATAGGAIQADETQLLQFAEQLFENQKRDERVGPVWNGRQIRNAFQSAVALAGFNAPHGQPLTLNATHFEKVSRVSSHFNEYLWNVRGTASEAKIAAVSRLRMDNFTPSAASSVGSGWTDLGAGAGAATQLAMQNQTPGQYGLPHAYGGGFGGLRPPMAGYAQPGMMPAQQQPMAYGQPLATVGLPNQVTMSNTMPAVIPQQQQQYGFYGQQPQPQQMQQQYPAQFGQQQQQPQPQPQAQPQPRADQPQAQQAQQPAASQPPLLQPGFAGQVPPQMMQPQQQPGGFPGQPPLGGS